MGLSFTGIKKFNPYSNQYCKSIFLFEQNVLKGEALMDVSRLVSVLAIPFVIGLSSSLFQPDAF